MFKILIDTCVWLDIAKDYQRQPVLGVLEALVRARSRWATSLSFCAKALSYSRRVASSSGAASDSVSLISLPHCGHFTVGSFVDGFKCTSEVIQALLVSNWLAGKPVTAVTALGLAPNPVIWR